MRKADIEYWALNVIDRVEKGQPVEDSRVELKAVFIDPAKVARRIAGHANAAHGEPILWLIGVDEKVGVKGVDYNDFAGWFSKIQSCYDGVSPDLTSINIPYKDVTILAIIFETDRAPYVIKNPSGGSTQFEVPWREGTFIRSANRAELLRILVPLQRLPTIEVLSGTLMAGASKDNKKWRWNLNLQLYAASMLQYAIAIPFHRCSVIFKLSQYQAQVSLMDLRLAPPTTPNSLTIDGTGNELMIQGPGKFFLEAWGDTVPPDGDITDTVATIHADLHPVDSEHKIVVTADLVWSTKNRGSQSERGLWAVNGL